MDQHLPDVVRRAQVEGGRFGQEAERVIDSPLQFFHGGQVLLDQRLSGHEIAGDALLLDLEVVDVHGVGEVGVLGQLTLPVKFGDAFLLQPQLALGVLHLGLEPGDDR